jgi:hypothetical protein
VLAFDARFFAQIMQMIGRPVLTLSANELLRGSMPACIHADAAHTIKGMTKGKIVSFGPDSAAECLQMDGINQETRKTS